MNKSARIAFASCGCLLFLLQPSRADDPSPRENLNAGYFLLHKLMDDEAKVPILLDIKTSPKDIQDFAIEVSRTAKDGEAALEKMRDADPHINWDKNPLPKFEQDVRASITDEKEHQLLFGTKGPDFARAFLVSQAEASMYATHVTKILAEQDKSPARQHEFLRLSAQWHALYEKDFRLLRNY